MSMKEYGVFLGYGPDQSFAKDGIGRLIGFLLSGSLKIKDCRVTIACPGWCMDEVDSLLDEFSLDKNKFKFITTDIPVWVRWKRLISKKVKSPGFWKHTGMVGRCLKGYLLDIVSATPFFSIFKMILFLVLIMPLFLVALLVFAGLFIVVDFIIILFAPIFAILKYIKHNTTVKLSVEQNVFLKKVFSLNKKIASTTIKKIGNVSSLYTGYDELRSREFKKLIREINHHKKVKVWLSPFASWDEVKLIKARTVVVMPDIVFFDFPARYHQTRRIIQKMMSSFSTADHIVTYSQYVKMEHLVKKCDIPKEKISVIHHAATHNERFFSTNNMKYESLLILNAYREEYQKKYIDLYKAIDWSHLGGVEKFIFENMRYAAGLNYEDLTYIIFPTQARPNKNFRTLFEAIDQLIHVYKEDIKLILTTDINYLVDYKFIERKHLERNIVILSRVPNRVLVALNCMAACSVNPTLFEGGFPFPFTEAFSVGTPSVMGDIPVVREFEIPERIADKMLYSPYDAYDLAKKVRWAIHHKKQLYSLEKPFFDRYASRSWEDVADDYFHLMEQYE